MWNYIKNLLFSKTDEPEELSIDEEQEIISGLRNPESEETDQPFSNNFKSVEKVGLITFLDESMVVIDQIHFCSLTEAQSEVLKLNDKVKFTVYSDGTHDIIKNVEKVSDTVIVANENDGSRMADFDPSSVTVVSGQIFSRDRRNFEVRLDNSKDVVYFDLNSIKTLFLPSSGDYVDLQTIKLSEKQSEENENVSIKVVSVRPKKKVLKMGVVTSWDEKYGTINDFALFTSAVCESGFSPGIGGKVCASLIRSDCINGYKWRAINVIPQSNIISNPSISVEARRQIDEEFRNKRGISVSICDKITLKYDNQANFKLEVSNKSSSDKTMTVYSLTPFENRQVKLLEPNSETIYIKVGEVIEFTFLIVGKFVGKSYEDLIWDFEEFKIKRRIVFEVFCDKLLPESNTIHFQNNFFMQITSKNILAKSDGKIVPGRHRFCSVFIPIKIGNYLVPKNLIELALPEKGHSLDNIRLEVEKHYPFLQVGLLAENYREYMHTLLFMEEVQMLKKVASLDIENASFRKHLDYLVLDVPENSSYSDTLLPGDYVLASTPWDINKKMQGIIHKITKSEIWLMFSKDFHSDYKEGSTYYTTFTASRTTVKRMHQAIDVVHKYLGVSWLFPSCVTPMPPQVIIEEIEEGISVFDVEMPLKDQQDEVILKFMARGRGKRVLQKKGTYWNCSGSGYGNKHNFREYIPDMNTVRINQIKWFNSSLNVQQKQAVLRILFGVARPLPYIIFGPPGTGKTITIVEAILQIHKIIPGSRILVGTPTNSAADIIAKHLLESGNLQDGDFLRIVSLFYAQQGRLTSSLVPYSATPTFSDKDVKEDFNEIQSFSRAQIGEHRIVVGTLNTIGTLYCMGFPKGYFTHIFIDEAGQAYEPELLVPMTLLSPTVGHVILSGDPLQLGPVIFSHLAEAYGLNESFLFRILERFPYIKDLEGFPNNFGYDPRLVTKLINNYRSLQGILQVFNTLFYDGHLLANVSNETSEEAKLLGRLKSFKIQCPVLFHGLRGSSLQEMSTKSFYNPQEIFQVFCYLSKLYNDGVHPDQIGIITPYQSQVKKIREMLEMYHLEAPKIGSVEEFQGQERMVIILSTVRTSEEKESLTKFVSDPRRINVAISRAQALLIIIGDPELLDLNKIWHSILKYCVVNDSYVGCQLPQRFKLKVPSPSPEP